MKRNLFACAAVCALVMVNTAFAAPPQSTDQVAPQTTNVPLTMADIQVLAAALHVASSSCDTNPVGCQIGQVKDAELAKLNAAAQSLQVVPAAGVRK